MLKRSGLRFGLLALLLLLVAQPVLAQEGWKAEFYKNPYLLGDPVIQQIDRVNFDWGLWKPFDDFPVDYFSARFTTFRYFDAGLYRLSILADDSVRVMVDGNIVIDSFNPPRPGSLLTADVTLTAGHHSIQIDYRENILTAYISFDWARLDDAGGPSLPVIDTSAPLINVNPWTVTYYQNTDLSGASVRVASDSDPSRNFGLGAPIPEMEGDNFSVRWESVQPLEAGTYQIRVRADDGIRVYVNGGLVINEWHGAADVTYTANVTLSAGDHRFVVEYYEAQGAAFTEYNLARLGGSILDNGAVSGNPSAPTAVALPPTGYHITAADNLNIRSGPGLNFAVVGKLPYNAQADILGRGADDRWWLVSYNGISGWVASYLGRIQPDANINAIPIVR